MSVALNSVSSVSADVKSIMASSQAINLPREDVLRRKIKGELAEIQESFKIYAKNDPLTGLINAWLDDFVTQINSNAKLQGVVEAHIAQLQKMLIDPVSNQSLDEFSVLGNDGHVYSSLTVAMHKTLPENLRARSPMDVANADCPRFTYVAHEIVGAACKFLQKYNALKLSPAQQKECERLQKLGDGKKVNPALILKKLEKLDRLDRLQGIQQKRDTEKSEKDKKQDKKIEGIFAAKSKESERNFAEFDKNFEASRQENFALIGQQRADFDAQLNVVNRRHADSQNRVRNLEEQHAQLRNQVQANGNGINGLVAQDAEIRNKCAAVAKEIEQEKERERKFKKVLVAVAIVGACVFGGYMLSGYLSSVTGASVGTTIMPTISMDGLKLMATVAF